MSRLSNRLLASLSSQEYRRIAPRLNTLRLSSGSTLPQCGRSRVYFPTSGMSSILSRMSDGTTIEVASVGNEGVVGVPALGSQLSNVTYLHVSHGSIQYMTLGSFESLSARSEFGLAVDQYCARFMQAVMQLSACTKAHRLEARCARWILVAHERLQRVRFEVSQPFLAMALGVEPNALAIFMARLNDQKILKHDGASITVLDPIGLRRRSCNCQASFARLLEFPRIKTQRPPVRHRARVLSMYPPNVCTVCGLTRDYPHKTHVECLRAIADDLRGHMARAKELNTLRGQITVESFRKYEKFLHRKES